MELFMRQEYQKENYDAGNPPWPEGPLPTPTAQEAISAAKRLYRFGTGQAFKGKFQATTGNRYTRPVNRVYYVNPNRYGRGWRSLVHSVSHHVHHMLNPEFSEHDFRHAQIERGMIEYVLKNGWLEGKLRKPEKPKPDLISKRYAQTLGAIKRWEAKARRAAVALKKLRLSFPAFN